MKDCFDSIKSEIDWIGSYVYMKEEIEYGVKMVWRNSNCCIGRLFWNLLNVIDRCDVWMKEDVWDVFFYYIEIVINNGKIRLSIMIFFLEEKGEK